MVHLTQHLLLIHLQLHNMFQYQHHLLHLLMKYLKILKLNLMYQRLVILHQENLLHLHLL